MFHFYSPSKTPFSWDFKVVQKYNIGLKWVNSSNNYIYYLLIIYTCWRRYGHSDTLLNFEEVEVHELA